MYKLEKNRETNEEQIVIGRCPLSQGVKICEKGDIMKRKTLKNKGIALLLVIAMAAASMTGCGNKEEVQEPATEIDFGAITGDAQSVSNNAPETPATEESSTEQATEEVPPEGMYRSEITNEWIDESLKDQRPIAVMVDNEV